MKICKETGEEVSGLKVIIQEDVTNAVTLEVIKKWYGVWNLQEGSSKVWEEGGDDMDMALRELIATDNVKSVFNLLMDHRDSLADRNGNYLEVKGVVTNPMAKWLIVLVGLGKDEEEEEKEENEEARG